MTDQADREERLREIEPRIERGLFHDYRETGELLREIRDDKLFKPEYRTFKKYIKERWEIGSSTAYAYIQAADVAADLSAYADIHDFPQRHAQLLWRFDRELRIEGARAIRMMTHEEASLWVLENLVDEKGPGRKKRKKHDRDALLALLNELIEGSKRFRDDSAVATVVKAAAALDKESKDGLVRGLRRASKTFDRLQDAIRAGDAGPAHNEVGGGEGTE